MALDYLSFKRLVELIKDDLIDGKISKISQISNEEFLFIIRKNNENKNLLISTHPNMSYINLISQKIEKNHLNSNFVLLLKKHLENGRIVDISQQNNDRIMLISIMNRDDYFNNSFKKIYVELIGRASNLIMCDENNKILDSLKKIPLEYQNLRTIQPGIIYTLPPHPENEKLPYNIENELNYRKISLESLKDEINISKEIYITSKDKKSDFHFVPFAFMEGSIEKFPWNLGLEKFYADILSKERHRQYTSEMEKLAKNEIKKNEKKVLKLYQELDNAKQAIKFKEYGDLLLTYCQDEKITENKIVIDNEFVDEKIIIPIDNRFDIFYNANNYYKKYQKSKNALIKIQEQIDICHDQIDYFKSILFHLSAADIITASQIKEELIAQGYFRKYQNIEKTKNKKSKKVVVKVYKPKTFKVDDTIIYVGQNNLQNEYLTFKIADKNHMFFHVQQGHGAHVVVASTNLSEKIFRSAAMLAAYYSEAKLSSSVAVNYTLIKNIKKIPGGKPGKVIITNQKTIYIDPDQKFILNLECY